MTARLTDLMRRHGQEVIHIPHGPGEVQIIHAFLQPILKNREDLPVTPTPLGAVNDQRWLYIGPAEVELLPGDHIRCGETYLTVQETVTVRFRKAKLYRRAILRQEKEVSPCTD